MSEGLTNMSHESKLCSHILSLKYILILSLYQSNMNAARHPRVNKTCAQKLKQNIVHKLNNIDHFRCWDTYGL